MKLNHQVISGMTLLIPLLTGCSSSASSPGAPPPGVTVSVPRKQDLGTLAVQWAYPKIFASPSSSSAAGHYLYGFRAEDSLPKVWQFYAKRLGLTEKYVINASGSTFSSQGTSSHQLLYQTMKTDNLQTAFFLSEDATVRISISLSQAKGEKITAVAIGVSNR